jgi:hypothetical protein
MENIQETKKSSIVTSIEKTPWTLIIILLYNFFAIFIVLILTIKAPVDYLSTILGTLFIAQTSILLIKRNIIGWYFMIFWTTCLIIKLQPVYIIKYGLDITFGFNIGGNIFGIDILALLILILTLISKKKFKLKDISQDIN